MEGNGRKDWGLELLSLQATVDRCAAEQHSVNRRLSQIEAKFEGTEGPWANDSNTLQHEVAVGKHDIANCTQGLLKLQDELRQMQERAAESEERAAKSDKQVEGQSLELQQLRDELIELIDKVKRWSPMQEGVEREEAKVGKVTRQPPILASNDVNVQLEKEEDPKAEASLRSEDLDLISSSVDALERDPPHEFRGADFHVDLLQARTAPVEPLVLGRQRSRQAKDENPQDHESEGEAHKKQDGLQQVRIQKSLMHAQVDELLIREDSSFTLEPSAWESPIFIGLAPIRRAGSVLLILALITNISMQVILSVIIERTFSAGPVSLEAMEQWRHVIGHHISQVDAYGISLVSKVCESHSTLSVASHQNDVLESSRIYIESGFDGPVLCVLVIMVQYMIWMRELQRTLTIMKNVWYTPVSAETSVSKSDNEMLTVNSFHLNRKLFMYLVCLARIAVASMLLARGTFWLVYTISVTELVLNAVALEFIESLDELIYDIFATRRISIVVERTRVQTRYSAPFGGYIASPRVYPLIAFTLTIFCLYVYPHALLLKDVIETTCGGERDFAVAHHDDLDMVIYAPTRATSDIDTNQLVIGKVTKELIGGTLVNSAALLPDVAAVSSFMSKDASEVGDFVHLMTSCRDILPSEHLGLWQFVQMDLSLPENTSCADARFACGDLSLPFLRGLCPNTCRCFYAKPSYAISKGCPIKCQYDINTAGYYDNTLSCIDEAASSLKTNSHWRTFWMTLNSFKTSQGSTYFREVVDYAMKFGCAVIREYQLFDEVCAEVSNRHSLGTFCPEACDCQKQDFFGCPEHCWYGDDSFEDDNDGHGDGDSESDGDDDGDGDEDGDGDGGDGGGNVGSDGVGHGDANDSSDDDDSDK